MKKIEIPLSDREVCSPGVPIYLISTINNEGIYNVAPFGFVMPASYDPPIYIVGSVKDRDTYHNILETKEFVLNIPSTHLLNKVNVTGIKFYPGIDEFKKAKLTPQSSFKVKPPLVKECKAHFECILLNIYNVTKTEVIMLGEVVSVSVDQNLYFKDYVKQKGKLDPLFYVENSYFGLGRYVGKRVKKTNKLYK